MAFRLTVDIWGYEDDDLDVFYDLANRIRDAVNLKGKFADCKFNYVQTEEP